MNAPGSGAAQPPAGVAHDGPGCGCRFELLLKPAGG